MTTKRRKRTAERQLHIFSGSVYPELAQEIAGYLDVELGDIKLEKFANGECYARYMECDPRRGRLLDPVRFG